MRCARARAPSSVPRPAVVPHPALRGGCADSRFPIAAATSPGRTTTGANGRRAHSSGVRSASLEAGVGGGICGKALSGRSGCEKEGQQWRRHVQTASEVRNTDGTSSKVVMGEGRAKKGGSRSARIGGVWVCGPQSGCPGMLLWVAGWPGSAGSCLPKKDRPPFSRVLSFPFRRCPSHSQSPSQPLPMQDGY